MRLTEVSQTNPAAVIAGALIVLLFGAVALAALPIQLLPNISQPRITVVSGWREAAPRNAPFSTWLWPIHVIAAMASLSSAWAFTTLARLKAKKVFASSSIA